MGRQLNILPENASNILVAAAILTITINPLLYRAGGAMEKWFERATPGFTRWLHRRMEETIGGSSHKAPSSAEHRAIVIGYGPVGQTVARLLRENQIEPTIVELNVQTVQRLRSEGVRAIYGDAMRVETLMEAGITHANALVLSASNIRNGRELVAQAHKLNPRLRVLARTAFLSELSQLKEVGVDAVFSGEGEVAMAMTEYMLRNFGATSEQIDRERDRVRTTLFSAVPTGAGTAH